MDASIFKREVYRNLHFRDDIVYSVRKDGLVEGHALMVILDGSTAKPVKLAVGPKGNERVREEQRKNVHAVVRGHMVNAVWYDNDMDAFDLGHAKDVAKDWQEAAIRAHDREGYRWLELVYNPYKYKTFMTRDTDPLRSIEDVYEPVFTARKVIIGPTCWAQVPVNQEAN